MSRNCEFRALQEFGQRLRSLRALLGFDFAEFAMALGIELRQLDEFEGGRRQPRFQVMRRIAELTTCDLDFLITGKTFDRTPAHYGHSDEWLELHAQAATNNGTGPAWYWESDDRYRVTKTFRPKGEQGRPNGIIGLTRWDYVGIDPEEDAHWAGHVRSLEARRPIHRFVFRGRNCFIKISGKPAFDGTGRFLGYRGYAAPASLEEAIADWKLSFAR